MTTHSVSNPSVGHVLKNPSAPVGFPRRVAKKG
jgi:hypothetical protein